MAYDIVNRQWPDELPVPTGQEAISAVKRLYRFAPASLSAVVL